MKEKPPLVTIGLPVWNGEEYLEGALTSVLSQTYRNFILIISDNASIDRTEEICRDYAKRDPRITYLRHEQNISAKENFLSVLDLAKTEYFMWATDDDHWDPTFVSTLLPLLEANKKAVLAYSGICFFTDDNVVLKNHPHLDDYPLMRGLVSKDIFERLYLFIQLDDGKSNLTYGLMRTKYLKKIEAFKELGVSRFATHGADMLMIFRLLNYGEFVFSNDVLFHKRISHKKENPAIISRIRRFGFNHCWKFQYFLMYIPLIKDADITRMEKMFLTLYIFPRIIKWELSLVINNLNRIVKIR